MIEGSGGRKQHENGRIKIPKGITSCKIRDRVVFVLDLAFFGGGLNENVTNGGRYDGDGMFH